MSAPFLMKRLAAACALVAMAATAQAQHTLAAGVPGVVSAGTPIEFIKDGFNGTEGPIGLPDGSLIFTETQAERITRIAPDGSTSVFLDKSNGANGLAVDALGRLFVASTAGIQVFDEKGQALGVIALPKAPQNLAFAGSDRRTLYVVGRGAAYRIATLAPGVSGRAK